MTQKHPITPPPELVEKWASNSPIQANDENWAYELFIAHQAARWGADQELEACCEILRGEFNYHHLAEPLRAARRLKPPSLKQLNLKHLKVMERDNHYLPEIIADLRRAIESLPD